MPRVFGLVIALPLLTMVADLVGSWAARCSATAC